MADEIAEFLRRAAIRRAEQMEQQRRAQQQPQSYQPPPAPLPSQPRPVLARPLAPVVEAEIVDDDEPVQLRPALTSKVAQHVAQHLDTHAFAERAGRLADTTKTTDERLAAHMHQAFDHQLGGMGAMSKAITAADTPDIDNEMKSRVALNHPLLSMLRNPLSMRNALILGELLQRPEQNW